MVCCCFVIVFVVAVDDGAAAVLQLSFFLYFYFFNLFSRLLNILALLHIFILSLRASSLRATPDVQGCLLRKCKVNLQQNPGKPAQKMPPGTVGAETVEVNLEPNPGI